MNFITIMRKTPRRRIGEILLDQTVLAGVGNYMRADVLYLARVDPRRRVEKLSDSELKRIYRSIKTIADNSYRSNGTTISTYQDVYLHQGHYEPIVYGRKTDAKGRVVKTMKVGSRTIWWVPSVQK